MIKRTIAYLNKINLLLKKKNSTLVGHPELLVFSLSEEVGKIKVTGTTDVKIGDRIMIIPNHSCSAANLTDYYIFADEDENVENVVEVDIIGNSTRKGL